MGSLRKLVMNRCEFIWTMFPNPESKLQHLEMIRMGKNEDELLDFVVFEELETFKYKDTIELSDGFRQALSDVSTQLTCVEISVSCKLIDADGRWFTCSSNFY